MRARSRYAADPVPVPAPVLPSPGGTRLSGHALARMAEGAAEEALADQDMPRCSPRPKRARAVARTRRGTHRVRIGLHLPYPVDLATVLVRLHRQVTERLLQLTEMTSLEVTLAVEHFDRTTIRRELR
jgi:uncharacterized alkaline shock family protein YloU